MIFRSQNPLSPIVDVTIGNVYIDYLRIVQIEMTLSENNHDLVKITFAGLNTEAVADYINAPVTISWHQDDVPEGQEFRGYVVWLEPQYTNSQGLVNQSPFQLTVVHCLGASFDMRPKVVRFWEEPTLLEIITAIGLKYQFSWSIPNDDFRFTRLTQTEESDWEFLLKVCDYLGYSVTIHGTHIHVFDRYKSLGRQISYHRLDVPLSNQSSGFQVTPGQILGMNMTAGNTTPYENTNTEFVNAMDNNGNIIGTLPFERQSGYGETINSGIQDQLAMNAVSYELAQRMVEGRARKKFPVRAVLQITGLAGVKPGGVVNIQKFNNRFDGFWYVESVCHTVTLDKYFTEVTVLKDATNDIASSVPAISQYGTAPESVLVDTKWKASTQLEEIYG